MEEKPPCNARPITGNSNSWRTQDKGQQTGCLITFDQVSFSPTVQVVWTLSSVGKMPEQVADAKTMTNSSASKRYLGHGHLLSQD